MSRSCRTLGILGGGGTGPELVDAALRCLRAVEELHGERFELIRFDDARWERAAALEVMDEGFLAAACAFYEHVRDRGGAILRGAVSAPVLYKLRERLQQAFKVNPLRGIPALAGLTRFPAAALDGLELTMVRQNTIGAFHSPSEPTASGARMIIDESRLEIEQFAGWVFGRARTHVALAMPTRKMGSIGALWEDVFAGAAAAHPTIGYRTMYPNLEKIGQYVRTRLAAPRPDAAAFASFDVPLDRFDVVAGPELFMDYLMDDAAWAIHGESFLGCSANYSPDGFASYQTVHGTISPIRGKDMANPIAMIFALAMCLRDSCGLPGPADQLHRAIDRTLAAGLRTFDIHRGDPRLELVGSRAMVDRIIADLRAGATDRGEGEA